MNPLVESLQKTLEAYLPLFDLPDEELSFGYREGGWNVRQILHHMADSESVLYYRIRRVLCEDNQVIWGFDQDAWVEKMDQKHLDLSLNKELFRANRLLIIDLIKRYYSSSSERSFVHSETGLRTLKDEFDKVGSHAESHLQQIHLALKNKIND